MSLLDPQGAMKALEDGTVEAVKSYFPYEGKVNKLIATNVYVGKDADEDDIAGQKRARLRGRTWATGVYGDFKLVNKETGKVIDESKNVRLASLPKLTRRFSYIIDGKEQQADNQWRLKSGVYSRQRTNGELEAQFNLAKGRGFRLEFAPEKGQFTMRYATTNVQLLPVLRGLGMSEDQIQTAFGSAVYKRLTSGRQRGDDLHKLAKALDPKFTGDTEQEAIATIKKQLDATELREDTTRLTLGKPFNKVGADVLTATAKKLISINNGEERVDNRDALQFKELWTTEDHIPERILNSKLRINSKLRNNVDRKDKVADVISNDIFNIPIKSFFTSTSITQQPNQNNPVDMLGGFLRTSILGTGAIGSEQAVTMDAKMIDPSTLGIIDPVHTPEGCFHPSMEVFTSTGWKRWDTVTAQDELACQVDGAICFNKPSKMHVYDYDGILYGANTPRMGYLVSEAHRLWCKPYELRSNSGYRFSLAPEVQGKERLFQTTHLPWLGGTTADYVFPEVEIAPNGKKLAGASILTWASFMGWFISEGNISSLFAELDHGQYTIVISQNELHVEECKKIEECLTELGFGWTVHRRDDGKLSYKVHAKQLVYLLREFGKSYDKFIPEYLLQASYPARVNLFDALLMGDGRTCPNHGAPQQVYCTTSKRLAADFERLAVGLGYSVSTKQYVDNREERYLDTYEIRVLRRNATLVSHRRKGVNHHYTTAYKGKVYCATVPGGLLYVRMGGKLAHWSGNSRSGITMHLSVGVSKRGRDPVVAVYETKTGKTVYKSPAELATGLVGFSDQWEEVGNKLHPLKEVVTAIPKGGGDPQMVAPSEVDYILRTPKSMFSVTANLIPFLPSDQAGRAGMATRHMEQTVALKYREPPLVQVASGAKDERFDTFEKMYGRFSTQVAPVSGKVISVTADEIVIQSADKKKHTVGIYNNFPLNEKKSFLHSTSLVAVGDEVKDGDVITDNNYTKNGVLSLGKNLRIGYMAFRGATFEDGIVVSESAAESMTSEHMSKPRAYLDRGMQTGLAKFRAHFPGVVNEKNAAKLDADGVVKPGQVVEPGEVIMTVLKKTEPSPEQVMLKGIHKSLAKPYKNDAVVWDSPYSGVVTDVVKNGNEIVAYVRTEEALEVGDKLSFRHGNKGIVSSVLPDEEMPRDANGEPLQIVVNFYGVPSRINVGQVLETMLAKAADKAGTTYAVDNFQPHGEKKIIQVRGHYRNIKDGEGHLKRIWIEPHDREIGYHELVNEAMKKVGVTDTEELFDPATGKSFGQVLVGKQYCIKLLHQVDKKLAARSYGYGNDYDANLVPKGGGDSGAQRYGELGTYAMLAHGSLNNLRESLSWKSDKNQSDVWIALQAGEPLPAPKPTFAYEKFLAYLNAVGLNVEKEGNELRLIPFTDEAIRARSNGALTDPAKVLRGKDLKPEPGGLFDEKITGGPGGKLWGHIELAERIPNPIFNKAIMSLLGITGAQYDAIISGNMSINGKSGPAALADALSKIDVDKELATEKEKLKTARRSALDGVYKRVKLLQALKNNRMNPKQAYTLSAIPVIPPVFRPVTVMEGGDLNIDGVNLLYRDLALLNEKLAEGVKVLPDSATAPLKKSVYDAVESLISAGSKEPGLTTEGDVKPPGILSILSGSSPKYSYVHQKLLDRKQDLTMRSVITPDMNLGIDEIALPREGAFEVFKPFVVKELVTMGYTPLKAREEVENRTSLANRALEVAVSKRPVMFKRDPVLHKFGVLGFNVRLHDGKDIRIPPIVVGGFNADFDGDTMSVFVPVSQQAIDEVNKMKPSVNMFNLTTGMAMYQVSNEAQLGIFLLTQPGKEVNKSFPSLDALIAAGKEGKVGMTDFVTVGKRVTSAGRATVWQTFPEEVRTEEMLTDRNVVFNNKTLQTILRKTAKAAPNKYANTVDNLKRVGFGHAHDTGFSFSSNDFKALSSIRDGVLKGAHKRAADIRKSNISEAEKEEKVVKIYTEATAAMAVQAKESLNKSGNNLYMLNKAGVKPGWDQVQQMILAPMLLANAAGRTIPSPVTRSYSEGLDSAGYWVASSGARKGVVEKVQSVRVPGALSKQIVNTVIPYSVTVDDCGTNKGISLDVGDSELADRFLAKDVIIGNTSVRAGTLLTPNVLDKFRQSKVAKVLVRSPMKCQAKQGLCSKCYGVDDSGKAIAVGTNIGILAGQSIGERGTQLSLKAFHTGGLAGTTSKVSTGLDRVISLLKMPETLPNSATLAGTGGKVQAIAKNPLGGYDVKINDVPHYVPGGRELSVTLGGQVEKGDPISDGPINPRELLALTSLAQTQNYMADVLYESYKSEGIKRRNAEVVIKSVTNLGVVDDPGDSDEFIRGDPVSLSYIDAVNKDKSAENQVKVTPVLRGLETLPLDRSTDWMARLQYRHLRNTFMRGAGEGWKSDIHGMSPVPGIIYTAELGKRPEGSGSPY